MWAEFSPRDAHVILAPSGEPHDIWYVVIEGPEKGLYRKYKEMKNARDAPMKDGGLSYRAGWFWCEEDAKNWVQAVAVCGFLAFVC